MRPVLDDIRFIADSDHRVVAMAELADGPCSRADLRSVTGASSATVGRLLGDFERREWLAPDGTQYVLTPLGRFVAEEFADFYTKLRVARDLRELLSDLPLDAMEFGIECLADASVTRATPDNPLAMASRIREYEHDSASSLTLTDFFPEPCIDGRHEAVVDGSQTLEAVFSPEVVEAAMASQSAEKFVELVAADRSSIYIYDDEIAPPVLLNDGLACLVVRNEENTSVGLIETSDERVVSWVRDRFEVHKQASTPVTSAYLSTVRDAPTQ